MTARWTADRAQLTEKLRAWWGPGWGARTRPRVGKGDAKVMVATAGLTGDPEADALAEAAEQAISHCADVRTQRVTAQLALAGSARDEAVENLLDRLRRELLREVT